MSSFAHLPRVSRREISHEPMTATHDHGAPPQRPERTHAGLLCPGSPPVGPVLPHLPRPHLGTGAAALLLAPQKRRRLRPSLHAPLLQRDALLLSARPHTRLVHAGAPAGTHHPPPPRCPPCGGSAAPPGGRHPLPHPRLLHHRLELGPPAPCSPLPPGLRQRWSAPASPCPPRPGRQSS